MAIQRKLIDCTGGNCSDVMESILYADHLTALVKQREGIWKWLHDDYGWPEPEEIEQTYLKDKKED